MPQSRYIDLLKDKKNRGEKDQGKRRLRLATRGYTRMGICRCFASDFLGGSV